MTWTTAVAHCYSALAFPPSGPPRGSRPRTPNLPGDPFDAAPVRLLPRRHVVAAPAVHASLSAAGPRA